MAGGVTALILGLWLAGCASPQPPPVDLRAPGWEQQEGQAVWRPRAGSLELAGELFLAVHPDGDFVVHFSKPPFDLVLARRNDRFWRLELPAEGRRFAGRGTGPSRWLWLHLPAALAGRPLPAPLEYQTDTAGGWRLVNRVTGETLEGYLTP